MKGLLKKIKSFFALIGGLFLSITMFKLFSKEKVKIVPRRKITTKEDIQKNIEKYSKISKEKLQEEFKERFGK